MTGQDDVDLPELIRNFESDLVALFNAPLVLDAPYLCNSISTMIKKFKPSKE